MLTANQTFDGTLSIRRAIIEKLRSKGIEYSVVFDDEGNAEIESTSRGLAYYVIEAESNLSDGGFRVTYKDYSGDNDYITELESTEEIESLIASIRAE